MKYNEVTVH